MEPQQNPAIISSDSNDNQPSSDNMVTEFKCKSCRCVLFYDKNITHPSNIDSVRCTSIFIEKMDWMTKTDETECKLGCPGKKCSAKLGKTNLSGIRCSCGEWIAPGFQVSKQAVDKLQKKATSISNTN